MGIREERGHRTTPGPRQTGEEELKNEAGLSTTGSEDR